MSQNLAQVNRCIPVFTSALLPLWMVLWVSSTALAEETSSADYESWQTANQNSYVFASAGAAFLDHKTKSRGTSSGEFGMTTDDEGKAGPVLSFGGGWHLHKYFVFEMSYSFMTGVEYEGTIDATNAVVEGNTLDGTPNYKETIMGHMVGLTIGGTSYDENDVVGFSFRAGGVIYDLSNELKLSGSGTLNGNAIGGGNDKIKVTDNGIGWMAGASFFMVPSNNSRLELRLNHMRDMEIKSFNEVSASTAEFNYRFRF